MRDKPDESRLRFGRLVLAATSAFAVSTSIDLTHTAETMHVVSLVRSKWLIALLGLGVVGCAAGLLLALSWTPHRAAVLALLNLPERLSPRWRWPAMLGVAVFCLGPAAFSLHPYWGARLDPPWTAVGIGWFAALAGMALAKVAWPAVSWPAALALSLLLLGSAYRIASASHGVSTSPLSLGWSEGSRLYAASLFFPQGVYGTPLPLPILHPSLHILLAIPFALADLPIQAHRAWQAALGLGLTAATAAALSKRLALKKPLDCWLIGLWAFLFLQQGPIYLHLLVPVLLVILGFSAQSPGRTLTVVLLASAWAGLSRINWYPVPAMLAACLYFLEKPVLGRRLIAYLAWPATWFVLGVLTALLTLLAYIRLSGNQDLGLFSTSLSSALLWYRLLPNATYAPGILPMILVVSAPLVLASVSFVRQAPVRPNPIRLLGLAAVVCTLFVGGLVVSVKIGGGGDLHNLDAYLVSLMLVGSHIVSGRMSVEAGSTLSQRRGVGTLQAALLVVVPVLLALTSARPLVSRDMDAETDAVLATQQRVLRAVEHGGEILFINQRQLVTFGRVSGVRMVPEYELDTLMEMAMAGNHRYLARFYRDLQLHRFDLIVSSPLGLASRGREFAWGEENDVWLERVVLPLICEYYPETVVGKGLVAFYVPRPGPSHCP